MLDGLRTQLAVQLQQPEAVLEQVLDVWRWRLRWVLA